MSGFLTFLSLFLFLLFQDNTVIPFSRVLDFFVFPLYNINMRQIYGFKVDCPEEWGDVFCEDNRCPEEVISSACHMYYDGAGGTYIGFDLGLGMPIQEMKDCLLPHSQKLGLRKVLPS